MSRFTVTYRMRLKSESNMRDSHWSQRYRRRKACRDLGFWLVKMQSWMAAPAALKVTLTRVAPSTGLDDDNLRGAFKSVRDGIADKLMRKDNDPDIEWCYSQSRGDWGIEITIEESPRAYTNA